MASLLDLCDRNERSPRELEEPVGSTGSVEPAIGTCIELRFRRFQIGGLYEHLDYFYSFKFPARKVTTTEYS
jgi:ATP-dependent DNA ligase